MSARQALIDAITGADDMCYCGSSMCTAREELIDAFAHELAEKIRNHWVPKEGQTATYMCGLDDGLDIAADLIDPQT